LRLDTPGTYTLAAKTSSGLVSNPSGNLVIVGPDHLAFGVQSGQAIAGKAMLPAIAVRAIDAAGNLLTSDNWDQITLSVASGPGSFDSASTLTARVANGVATFDNVVLDTPGDYTLRASSPSVATGIVSNSFTVIQVTQLSPGEKYIRALYAQALGRSGSYAEWDTWVPFLSAPSGRFLVATGIQRSPEALDHLVIGYYEQFLGRDPQNGEELTWVAALQNGTRPSRSKPTFLSSPEYYARTPHIAGGDGPPTAATFIQSLYLQVLRRPLAPFELSFWPTNLDALGRLGVATAVLASTEYRIDEVADLYQRLLSRGPVPSEYNFWVNSGLDALGLYVGLEMSPEYFADVTK
jgi:hypothetical protein